ncbi:MAG: hypothetical protein FWF52_00410 [Candidatus Azobacteroides sp.]|nr:hypothetical protein [Candidatus Azobacteroides sp.]
MKGINFIEPMFRAIIEGRKTQTRRIMKPHPNFDGYSDYVKLFSIGYYGKRYGIFDSNDCFIKPRYKAGETLYLKEPYFVPCNIFGQETQNFSSCVVYYYGTNHHIDRVMGFVKKNKLFMPEKYARYFIEITAVCCEYLQDISDEDCIKEGVIKCKDNDKIFYSVALSNTTAEYTETPREAYAALIDKINGRSVWESNPYVWVYEFNLVNDK